MVKCIISYSSCSDVDVPSSLASRWTGGSVRSRCHSVRGLGVLHIEIAYEAVRWSKIEQSAFGSASEQDPLCCCPKGDAVVCARSWRPLREPRKENTQWNPRCSFLLVPPLSTWSTDTTASLSCYFKAHSMIRDVIITLFLSHYHPRSTLGSCDIVVMCRNSLNCLV